MSDDKRDAGPETPHEAQALSTSRLFLIVVVFLALAAYSIWNSDRFQTLMLGVSEQRLSELLQRPVSFRRVSFQIFPPSVNLADVRIGNDPRLPEEPLFAADELTIGGGFSLTGGELRFGRVRAVAPKISLVQFPDGTWNLPPGLTGPAEKGGLEVRVGELVAQRGLFQFEGRRLGIDGKLEELALELNALTRKRYAGMLACRRVTLALPAAEPLVFGLDLNFRLDPASGAAIETLSVIGDFGQLTASGSVEDLAKPEILLRFSGEFHVEEVERLFHAKLGFSGDARVAGDFRLPPGGHFAVTARIAAPRVEAHGFTIEGLEASAYARPEALIARIEKARYAGGQVSGSFRIENLAGRPQPMTLALEARGVSLESFFADLNLPGTGLSGAMTLSAALSWGEGGLERADGGGRFSIEPGPAASIVPGRFGVPTAGGGPLMIVDGRIGLERAQFRLPASTIEATGGLRIGQWLPDFDFELRSRDLAEIDRVFQNFTAAGGSRPEPLGLGGTGEAVGHISRSWGDPDVTAQFSAENARFADVTFGSVRGTTQMHDGAFLFHPLRVYDGNATLSLEGTLRYRRVPGRQALDFTLTAHEYPLQRFLDYLDLDYPIEGRVTGRFPISGDPPDAVSGGGLATLDDAVLWGQRVSRATARMTLAPGVLALDDVRADVGGGVAGGRGLLAFREKTFKVRLAGDGIPLGALDSVAEVSRDISGRLSFELTGSGSFERPDLTVSASLEEAEFFGHPIPAVLSPKLSARIVRGELDGSVSVPGKWALTGKGTPFTSPAGSIEVALDAPEIAALLELTPLDLPPGVGGALSAEGRFTIPWEGGGKPTGELTVTRVRLDTPKRPGLVQNAAPARLRVSGDRVTLEELRATGEGIDLRLRGTLDASAEKPGLEARISGTTDAALLELAVPDLGLSGRLTLDLAASGPPENLAFNGSVRLEDGRYRTAGYSFDGIEGTVRLSGAGGEVEGVRAKVGEGEAFAAGNFRVEGLRLKDFRLALQGRRIQVRAIPSLRLTVDADLVASGNEGGNQLRGEVTLLRGSYTKDVQVTLSDLLGRSRPVGALAAREPWKERTSLEVRIVSAASLEVRNNLARISGTVDLTVRGTVADPILLGQIILDEGGRVIFSDIRYEVESGTVTFSNTTKIAPFIDVRARAEVKAYELVVSLLGTWPRITPTFTSDPPLSNDAILGLILSGVPPDTRASVDTSSQLVSAAGGVLTGAVTGGITRQTQKFFKLDRFQIDPVFEGSTLSTFRTTIGKQITQDLSVTSSIAVDSSKDPIVRVEWQATDTILVQLIRDENGILQLTFRRRQRL